MKVNPYKRKPKQYHKKRRKHPRYSWTPEKYAAVVGGTEDSVGLRSIVKGFERTDGFDLRNADQWTRTQRDKVRKWFSRLEALQAQPKRMVRATGERLRKLQDAFHGEIPSAEMKVAFIPDTEPKFTLPGAKKHPPKIRVLKEGVSVKRSAYERVFIPFNQVNLVKNARQEIKDVAAKMPNAKLFYIQAGEHQTLNGMSLGILTEQVLDWMQKYDGKRQLPRGSGNSGDDPKHHHWKKWLNGLIGYIIPSNINVMKVAKMVYEGRKANQKLKEERQRLMRRKGMKGYKIKR